MMGFRAKVFVWNNARILDYYKPYKFVEMRNQVFSKSLVSWVANEAEIMVQDVEDERPLTS